MVEGKQQEIEFKICSEYWYLFEPLQKLKFPDGVADHPIRTSLGVAHFLFLIQGVILFFIRRHQPSCHPPPIFCNSFFKSSLVYFRRIFHLTALTRYIICIIKLHRCLISNHKTYPFVYIQLSQITITLITYILPHFIIKYTHHEDLRGYNCALTLAAIDFPLDVNTMYYSNPIL